MQTPMQTPMRAPGRRGAVAALVDGGVGVGVAVGVLAASGTSIGPPWIGSPRGLDAVAVGLVVVVAVALAVRRRYPVGVLVVANLVVVGWAAGRYPGRLVLAAPLLACYSLAVARGWRWGLAGVVVTAVGALAAIRVAFGAAEPPAGVAGSVVWMAATAGAAGTAVGYYRALLVATRVQLARQAQAHQEQARRRAVEERLRIARELHDVVGHTMATISVQAGVGIHLPAQAVAALATIKQISDQALADVKAILGVLRADPDPDPDPEQPRAPRGGLDQVEVLLGRVRAAGVAPRLSVHGPARPLPAAVDLAAYRIIQEALTNVLRHAHARTVWLEVRYEPARVVIGVVDDGTAPPGGDGLAGHGISGMRERALAFGGQLSAGPRPDGGFQVRCALPTPPRPG